MSTTSRIEWTEATLEPHRGLHQDFRWLQALLCGVHGQATEGDGHAGYEHGFALTLLPERLLEPYAVKADRVFRQFYVDLFHERVPERYIDRVIDVIRRTYRTTRIRSSRNELRAWRGTSGPERYPITLGSVSRSRTVGTVFRESTICARSARVFGFSLSSQLLEDVGQLDLAQYSLGDRRWRIRSESAANATGVG